MMNTERQPYWFPAKRYGWGWGLPCAWQGWVIMIAWIVLVTVLSPMIALHSMLSFFIFIFGMAAVLIAICWAKGEPPKWRWGKG
jgi:uncharacterized membrane protein YhaH (DUF805 family)